MAKAKIRLFKDDVLLAETDIETKGIPLNDSVIDMWTDILRTNKLTLGSLNALDWNNVEFDVDGVIYTRINGVTEDEN